MTLAALALSLFMVTTPVTGTPSFDLHSFTFKNGTPIVTVTGPELLQEGDVDGVRLSFVAPLDGKCAAIENIVVDGVDKDIILGMGDVTKGEVQAVEVPLYSMDELKTMGATSKGYIISVICMNEEHKDAATALYSKYYTNSAVKSVNG